MVEEIVFENGRTAYRHATLIDLYLHAKISLKSKEHFVDGRTYARMYGRMDGHLRPALLGPLCRTVDLKIRPDQI